MAVREYSAVALQLGVESTSGTAVAANKVLEALTMDVKPAFEKTMHRPSGYKVPVASSTVTEQTEGDAEGPIDYNAIVYPLSSLFGATSPETVETGVYEWEWTFTAKASITPKTFTFESGDGSSAHEFSFGVFSGLDLSIDRTGDNTMSSSVFGRAMSSTTMTASPTIVPLMPVDGQHWDVFADDAAEDLGDTKLMNLYEANLSFGDLLEREFTINSANSSFNAVYGAEEPSFEWSMTVAADAVGMAYLNTARTNAKKFIRLQATGPEIAEGERYGITFDFCTLVSDIDSFQSSDGKYVVPLSFNLAHDATWAKSMTIKVQNTLAGL